jgi:cation:H+ antiporter
MAHRFNINSVVVGVFLVSLGTAAPDLVSTLTALFEGHPDISIGNILGSNFSNLALGFGVASLVMPFKCTKKIARVEFPLLFALTVFFVLCCFDGKLVRFEGIILLLLFVAYILLSLRRNGDNFVSMEHQGADGKDFCPWSAKTSVSIFVIAAILLASGAHIVVSSCIKIADVLKVSQTFIGFSLLALGTSAPEIFVVTTAARRHHHVICSGNIVGSNLINLMFVAGLCATIHPIIFQKDAFWREAIALIFITLLSWYIFRTRRVFSRACGALFVATYLIVMFLESRC